MKGATLVQVVVSALAFVCLMQGDAAAEVTQVTLDIPMICCRTCAVTIGKAIYGQPWVEKFEVAPGKTLVRIRPKPMSQVDLVSLMQALQGHGFELKQLLVDLKGRLAGEPERLLIVCTGTQQLFTLHENDALTRLQRRLSGPEEEVMLRGRVTDLHADATSLVLEVEGALPVRSLEARGLREGLPQ